MSSTSNNIDEKIIVISDFIYNFHFNEIMKENDVQRAIADPLHSLVGHCSN